MGFGVGSASFTVKDDDPVGSVDVTAVGPSLELAFGGTLARGLVLGGGIYGSSASSPEYESSNLGAKSDGGAATLSMVGPFIDWYPSPASGFHVEAALGYSAFAAGKGDPYPGEDASGSGFGLVGGAGYELWVGDQWSIGALGRIQYFSGSVEGDDSGDSDDVSGTVLSLLLTATYH